MKQQRFWRVALTAVSITPLLGGCLQRNSHEIEHAASPVEPVAVAVAPAEPDTDEEAAEVSDAPIQRVSGAQPLPPSIKANPALAEVVEFSNSGVHETVLLTYVANATALFALGADEIIFLNDVGVPPAVVAAMIEHDALLKQRAAEPVQQPPAGAPTNGPVVASAPTYSVLPEYSPVAEPMEPAPVEFTESYPPPEAEAAPLFYDSLAPYGTWVDVDGYGRCWQPSVVVANPDWRPYCDRGHWAYTDCGWYWVSDYSWGWAPFHYGRWFQHGRLGWCWAPDKVWGPSWVSWRYSNDYCGWAPLPPRACYTAAGLTYNNRLVAVNFDFHLRPDCYTFVHYDRLHDRRLSSHKLSRDHVNRIIDKTVVSTKIIGGQRTVSNDGLSPDKVAEVTRRQVPRATIREVNATGQIATAEKVDSSGQTVTVLKPSWRPPLRSLAKAAAPDPSVVPTAPASKLWDRPGSPARSGSSAAVAANQLAPGPASAPMPRRPVRTGESQPVPVAQPAPVAEVATATPRSWQQPRSIQVPRTTPGPEPRTAVGPLIVRRQSDVTSQPAQAAPEWQWQPSAAAHAAPEARPAPRGWQTPRVDTPRTPSYEAPAAPAQVSSHAPTATPRWDRPRQEAAAAPQTMAPAPAPRTPTWHTPARSGPSDSPRSAPETHSAPARSSSSSAQSQPSRESRSSESRSAPSRQENSSSRSQSSDSGSRGGRR